MPDYAELKPLDVHCRGGLILDRSPQEIPQGAAIRLENFEPDIAGGYRRINGFNKYSLTALAGSGKVLGIAFLGTSVIACRGANVQHGTGGTWTSIATNRTAAGKYVFDKYNWTGTEKIVLTSGQAGTNYAATWDGTNYVLMNGAVGAGAGTAPTNPTYVVEHKDHMWYAQGEALTFSAPFLENNFTTGAGAGSIIIPEAIVGLASFRETLFILARNSIYKITGTSKTDFKMLPVSNNIGCLSAYSIQEIGGDVIFMAPDGLRSIAGTERLDDIELGTISKPVQPRFNDVTEFDDICTLVIRNKSQYRFWYPVSATAEIISPGIMAVLRRQGDSNVQNQDDQSIGWEFADMIGIKPSYAASGFLGVTETFLHGGFSNGILYKQEQGSTFDTETINAVFQSPHFDFGDVGIRKTGMRIITTVGHEGTSAILLYVLYDYDSSDTPQPNSYNIGAPAGSATYGTAVYGTNTYSTELEGWSRQSVEGGGFVIGFRFENKINAAEPFSIKSYQLEVDLGGRR